MQWQAIAGVTGQLNDMAKECLVRKLEKDAAVEAPKVWSEFLSDTTKHLHNSQNFLEVKGNDKTGGLSALMQFDELHQDYHKYHNKPALDYILDKYDERASGYLSSVKNSITRKILQEKFSSYRTSIAGNVADTEIRLVDGKRQSMAVENIEGLKNVTYDNPSLFVSNLNDAIASISSLALAPQAKEKLIHTAKHEISQAAALGLLRQSPESLLTTLKNNKSDWTQFLSLEQRIRLENQASNVIRHKQHLLETQIKSMAPAHMQNIIETGSGLNGFAEHVEKVLSHDSPLYKHIKEEEALHHQAFFVMQRINQTDFAEGVKILSEFKPNYIQGDNLESSVENYRHFRTQDRLYSLLTKEFDKRQKEAMDDPAMFAEKYNSDIIPNDIPLVQRLILRKNLQQQKGIPQSQVRYLTNNERLSYIERFNTRDPQIMREEIEGIISIGKGDHQIGFEVLGELLKDNDKLNPVIYFLAKNSLYKGVSKECADAVTEFSQIAAVHDQLFSSDSDTAKKAVIDAIAANTDLKEWEADMTIGQPYNLKLISHAKQAVKYAARYYMTQALNKPVSNYNKFKGFYNFKSEESNGKQEASTKGRNTAGAGCKGRQRQ